MNKEQVTLVLSKKEVDLVYHIVGRVSDCRGCHLSLIKGELKDWGDEDYQSILKTLREVT